MKWFHFHKWVVTGVDQMGWVTYSINTRQPFGVPSPITEILYQCEVCHTHRTITLRGHWTLDQLKPL
jgi:hypothetical protein